MVTTRHIRSSFNLSQIKVQKTSIAVRCQFESCMLDHLIIKMHRLLKGQAWSNHQTSKFFQIP